MCKYEESMTILEDNFGNGKDNIISLATIALKSGSNEIPCPAVRDIDAYYEDGVFYAVTYAKSNKILEIAQNKNIAISTKNEVLIPDAPPKTAWLSANAEGENLGWVLDPKNSELREKLRIAFKAWYDFANNENDENCCFLAIKLTHATLNINHFQKLYTIDFASKTATVQEKE